MLVFPIPTTSVPKSASGEIHLNLSIDLLQTLAQSPEHFFFLYRHIFLMTLSRIFCLKVMFLVCEESFIDLTGVFSNIPVLKQTQVGMPF